ncbi:hypothetical protein KY363_01040 [Candidatus Woesearchaeota archaeon]|nr:hypothetical protein [Candidatus Woesearchaeota archaeon]
MSGQDDISEKVSTGSVLGRRSFLEILLGVAIGAGTLIIPSAAGARGGWNISYGLAKGENALVELGRKYDVVKKELGPSLADKLVIEKSPSGNYFLVLRLNTSANSAQRIIRSYKSKGIDAALRRYCNCDAMFPPKGASPVRPQPAQRPVPRPEPVSPVQPVGPAPEPVQKPAPRLEVVYKPQRAVPLNSTEYVPCSSLDLNNLESVLGRQYSLEVGRGNISRRDVLYAYVEAGPDMPVMLRSDARIAGVWKSAEDYAVDVEKREFIAAIGRRSLARQGVLVSALPSGAMSRADTISKGDVLAEGARIYARSTAPPNYYHQYTVVIALKGPSSRQSKSGAMARLSRIIYEAMRSRNPLE